MADEKPSVDSVFCAAIEIESAEERQEYVANACGQDSELLRQVDRLIRAHFGAGSFLESPPDGVAPSPTLDQPITEKPGTQIGPYKLLQQIGEGGMGVVYMAEQKEPVKRRVALKIIKPGMDTRQVIARFEAERQALAMMDHPNIAKVLDAGQTDSGRPYFVMELVKGMPVTKYCDEQHLTPKQRLELFVPICQAVQHAHQKGIIHRDLKPSNILVAFYDGHPVPKIIDFGVAKATNQTLTEKTMFTQVGQVVGTLEYMAPEQAQVNQLDVDTRSDIYSLGVVLYELLTGDTPFDRVRLGSAAFDEMLRIIREEEPSKPSTKVSSSQSLPSIAANRRIEPAKLGSMIRGELDWIVLKAMEKDRGRRYETANGFATDIERYLGDEPVTACPPSAAYRFRKFAQRNRTALAMSAVLAIALLTGTVISSWQAIRANYQSQRARAAERLAQERLKREQEALAEVSVERDRALSAEAKAEERFEIAADAVKRYLDEVTRDPQLENADFRELRTRLLESAISFYEKLLEGKPEDDEQRLQQARAHHRLFWLHYYSFSDYYTALSHAQQSANLVKGIPGSSAARHGLAVSYQSLSNAHERLGNHQQSNRYAKLAFEISRDLAKENPEVAAYQSLLAKSLGNWANRAADPVTSLRRRKEAIAVMETLYRQYPDNPEYGDGLSWWLWSMADDANSLQRSLQIRRKMAKDFPEVLKYREFVGSSLTSLGQWHSRNDKLEDAIGFHTRALEIREQLVEVMPKPMYLRHLWDTHRHLADVLEKRGDRKAAIEHLSEAITTLSDIPHNWDVYRKRGDLYRDTQQPEKAIADYTLVLEARPDDAYVWKARSICHCQLRNWEQALNDVSRAIELDPKPWMFSHRAWPLNQLSRSGEAITDCNRAIELDPTMHLAWIRRGIAWRNLGELDKAVSDYASALRFIPGSMQTWKELRVIANRVEDPCDLAALDALREQLLRDAESLAGCAEPLAQLYLRRAKLYIEHQNPEAAIADCDIASSLAPEDEFRQYERALRAKATTILSDKDVGGKSERLPTTNERG